MSRPAVQRWTPPIGGATVVATPTDQITADSEGGAQRIWRCELVDEQSGRVMHRWTVQRPVTVIDEAPALAKPIVMRSIGTRA